MIKRIKIIRPGYLIRSDTGIILDARSSVVLIQTEKYNLIIDTSIKKDRNLIINNLSKHDLTPKDIDIVINTHSHHDHTENNEIFESASIYSHHLNKKVKSDIKIKDFPFKLDKDILIIETPGHSLDCLSIILRKKHVFAITGDSIPIKNNIINWTPPIINIDREMAVDSMRKIIKIADVIIPGHDYAFKLKKGIIE
ncbi:MAG: MBL fold metallo-hydrolase [Candidatus Helarchaeota archaeon]